MYHQSAFMLLFVLGQGAEIASKLQEESLQLHWFWEKLS